MEGNKWSAFWSGLNIRKALTLMFGIAMIIGSLIVIIVGLAGENKDNELINLGLTGITTITTVCTSYYMGYSNGVNTQNKDKGDQL